MGCIARQLVAAAAGAVCLSGSTASSAGRQTRSAELSSHDGVYDVEIRTVRGACDRIYHWTINVASGRVTSPADGFMQASGQIDARGIVALAFRRDEQVANVAGRVEGRIGSGTWSSPTLQCAGYWSAALQG